MKIYELAEGTPLTFILTIKGQNLEFESKVHSVDPKHQKMYAEAVLIHGKVLGMHMQDAQVSVVATFKDEKPVCFNDITPILVSYDDTKCYSIACKENGVAINRRGYYRCYVGTRSEISLGNGDQPIPTIVRDVSKNGFAVILDKDILQMNQLIYCVLADQIEMFEEEFSFPMFGIVTRKQELPNGKIVYGCKLNRSVPGIDGYIAKKEREELARHRSDR